MNRRAYPLNLERFGVSLFVTGTLFFCLTGLAIHHKTESVKEEIRKRRADLIKTRDAALTAKGEAVRLVKLLQKEKEEEKLEETPWISSRVYVMALGVIGVVTIWGIFKYIGLEAYGLSVCIGYAVAIWWKFGCYAALVTLALIFGGTFLWARHGAVKGGKATDIPEESTQLVKNLEVVATGKSTPVEKPSLIDMPFIPATDFDASPPTKPFPPMAPVLPTFDSVAHDTTPEEGKLMNNLHVVGEPEKPSKPNVITRIGQSVLGAAGLTLSFLLGSPSVKDAGKEVNATAKEADKAADDARHAEAELETTEKALSKEKDPEVKADLKQEVEVLKEVVKDKQEEEKRTEEKAKDADDKLQDIKADKAAEAPKAPPKKKRLTEFERLMIEQAAHEEDQRNIALRKAGEVPTTKDAEVLVADLKTVDPTTQVSIEPTPDAPATTNNAPEVLDDVAGSTTPPPAPRDSTEDGVEVEGVSYATFEALDDVATKAVHKSNDALRALKEPAKELKSAKTAHTKAGKPSTGPIKERFDVAQSEYDELNKTFKALEAYKDKLVAARKAWKARIKAGDA